MTSRPKPRPPGYRGVDTAYEPRYEQHYEMTDRMPNNGGIATNDKAVDESSYPPHKRTLPLHHGKKVTKGVKAQGESGRRGIHPIHFLRICFRSSCTLSKFVNILWPFVPAAFGLVGYNMFGTSIERHKRLICRSDMPVLTKSYGYLFSVTLG